MANLVITVAAKLGSLAYGNYVIYCYPSCIVVSHRLEQFLLIFGMGYLWNPHPFPIARPMIGR
jgi:hypothetical protein